MKSIQNCEKQTACGARIETSNYLYEKHCFDMPEYTLKMFYCQSQVSRNIDASLFMNALVPSQASKYTNPRNLKFISMGLKDGEIVNGSIKNWAVRNAGWLKTDKAYDQYVTINNFSHTSRKAKDCFCVNGFVIDLDCHDVDEILVKTQEKTYMVVSNPVPIQRATMKTLRKLSVLWEADALPKPKIITFTGRGLQLLFVYNRGIKYSAPGGKRISGLIKAHKKVVRAVYDEYKKALVGTDLLAVDEQCSDVSRVVRLPGSWNSKAGRFSTLLHIDYKSDLDLFELQRRYYPDMDKKARKKSDESGSLRPSDVGKVLDFNVAQSILARVAREYKKIEEIFGAAESAGELSCGNSRYAPLLKARMRALIELQRRINENGQKTGFRHNLTFLYCNCVYLMNRCTCDVPGFPSIEEFNMSFDRPMSQSELDRLVNSITKRNDGYYYRNVTFLRKLSVEIGSVGMTNEEFAQTMASGQKRKRPSVSKMKRDAKIRVLAELDATNAYSAEELAELFQVHPATIYRWRHKISSSPELYFGNQVDDVLDCSNEVELYDDFEATELNEAQETEMDKQYAYNLFEDGMPASVIACAVNKNETVVITWIQELEDRQSQMYADTKSIDGCNKSRLSDG